MILTDQLQSLTVELLQALFDDKYSSELTRLHMTNMTTGAAMTTPSTQSPATSGEYDNATTQPGVDPNQHGT